LEKVDKVGKAILGPGASVSSCAAVGTGSFGEDQTPHADDKKLYIRSERYRKRRGMSAMFAFGSHEARLNVWKRAAELWVNDDMSKEEKYSMLDLMPGETINPTEIQVLRPLPDIRYSLNLRI
jgi:hypothetical protein